MTDERRGKYTASDCPWTPVLLLVLLAVLGSSDGRRGCSTSGPSDRVPLPPPPPADDDEEAEEDEDDDAEEGMMCGPGAMVTRRVLIELGAADPPPLPPPPLLLTSADRVASTLKSPVPKGMGVPIMMLSLTPRHGSTRACTAASNK